MTKSEVDAAKRRCEEATPGPWQTRFIYRAAQCARRHALEEKLMIGTPDEADWPDSDFTAHSRSDLPAALDMLERVMKFVTTSHELGCFVDDDDPDAMKLWHRAEALVREWEGKVTR